MKLEGSAIIGMRAKLNEGGIKMYKGQALDPKTKKVTDGLIIQYTPMGEGFGYYHIRWDNGHTNTYHLGDHFDLLPISNKIAKALLKR